MNKWEFDVFVDKVFMLDVLQRSGSEVGFKDVDETELTKEGEIY